MLSISIDSRRAFRDPSEPTSQTLHLQRPGREWAGAVGRKHHIYIDQQENPHLGLVLVSVVVSIPTCHAGDCGVEAKFLKLSAWHGGHPGCHSYPHAASLKPSRG